MDPTVTPKPTDQEPFTPAGKEQLQFREVQGGYFPVVLYVVIVALFFFHTRLYFLAPGGPPVWPVALGFVGLGIVLAGFAHLSISVTPRELTCGFFWWKRRIPRADILTCQPYRLRFTNYWGMGIRLGLRDRTVAYCIHMGPGVRISARSRKRDLVLSTDRAAELCRLLGTKSHAPG